MGRTRKSAERRAYERRVYQDPEYRRIRAAKMAGDPFCHWCGYRKATQLDHVTSPLEGGRNTWDNLVPACAKCNGARGIALRNKLHGQGRIRRNRRPYAEEDRQLRFDNQW